MEEALAGEIRLVIMAAVAIIAIVGWTIAASVRKVASERSRRELFAYVAEGSISPEQAKELLEVDSVEAIRKGVAEAVSIGVIGVKEVESFIRKPEKPASPAST